MATSESTNSSRETSSSDSESDNGSTASNVMETDGPRPSALDIIPDESADVVMSSGNESDSTSADSDNESSESS